MPFRALALLPVLLVLVACHSALDDAMASYEDARYPSAAAQFRALEPAARRLGARDFASYALYRGLTHLALGDARAAALWLGHAKVSADRDPGHLRRRRTRRPARRLALDGPHAGRTRV